MSETYTCHHCKEAIGSGKYTQVAGNYYHEDHFLCSSCQNQLVDGYLKNGDDIICQQCYDHKLGKKCHKCQTNIKGQMLQANGQDYHPDCFTCFGCSQPFTGGQFSLKDGNPFCLKCVENQSEYNCAGCSKKITTKVFNAVGKSWHPECFKCGDCKKTIESQFKMKGDVAYHANCAAEFCYVCKKTLSGEYYQVNEGDMVHKDCLNAYKVMKAGQDNNTAMEEQQKKNYEVPKNNDLINQAQNMLNQQKQGQSDSVKVFDYTQKIPFNDLITKKYDADIDVTSKEKYLTEEEFSKYFKGMSLDDFYEMKKWKQIQQKKDLKLF